MAAAVEGWLLGSQEFVDRIKRLVKRPQHVDEVPAARRLASASLADALRVTALHYGIDEASFCQKQSKRLTRAIAAWLARRTTEATLRELAAPLGLTHPDSVRNLLHRADDAIERSAKLRKEVARLRQSILGAQHNALQLRARPK